MQKPWSMYNKADKLRIDDLKPEHVKIILLSVPNAKMGDWYACQEGDLRWQPVSEISEFYEDVRQIKAGDAGAPAPDALAAKDSAVKPEAPRRPLFEEAPSEVELTAPSLMIENVHTKERRSARRYPRMLTFKVAIAGKTFSCETIDVSMSGISLETPLPTWIPKSFHAELTLNRNSVRILCTKVDDTKLKLTDADSWDVIRQWLATW